MKVWAYVFITSREPRMTVQAVREIHGVVRADGLAGTPDAIAIVEGADIRSMDSVIGRIAELPEVVTMDSKAGKTGWTRLLF